MAQLTATLSTALLELIDGGQAPIDGIEAGKWFTVRQVRAHRRALARFPFTFHGGPLIERVGLIPKTLSRISDYVKYMGSPWASFHMSVWLPGMVHFMLRHGRRLPPPDPERSTRRLVDRVARIAHALDVPVILENMPALPFEGCELEADPAWIRQVLNTTGCDLLLDIAHARVAASALGWDVGDYLRHLPLERVVQLHASGPRLRDGRLVDAHEPLLEADYDLLSCLLTRTSPKVVTLEYFREPRALCEQLRRLRELLGPAALER